MFRILQQCSLRTSCSYYFPPVSIPSCCDFHCTLRSSFLYYATTIHTCNWNCYCVADRKTQSWVFSEVLSNFAKPSGTDWYYLSSVKALLCAFEWSNNIIVSVSHNVVFKFIVKKFPGLSVVFQYHLFCSSV